MPRVKLTARFVETLKSPASGQTDYFDSEIPGFGLRISSKGKKTWTYCYRFHKRKRRLSIGPFPALSLADARKRARVAIVRVADGIDPVAEKIRAENARSFRELYVEFLEKHAKPRKRSWRNDAWMAKRHLLPRWGRVKAQDVSRHDVRALVETIADAGTPILANRVLALASKIFSFAVTRGWREDNPCRGVERPGVERRRDRCLTDDEMRRLWLALEQESPFHRALFQLRILTAARGGEIRKMQWDQLNFSAAEWTIPSSSSKNGEPSCVPLTEDASRILRELRVWHERRLEEINRGRAKKGWEPRELSTYVFPSPRGDRAFQWEQRFALRLRDKTGIAFRPHDLRRTVATALTKHCGVDRFLLKKILNHVVRREPTDAYDWNTYDGPKREALEAWNRRLQRIIDGVENDNVLSMKARSSR